MLSRIIYLLVVCTSEWLIISVFLSPLVLLFAGIRYGFARLKQQERQ